MNGQDDPYETLNLPRSATQAQIKAAYRKLALKYHPDKQKPNTTEDEKKRCNEQFAKIGNAYEILGDPDRRSEYDRFGTVTDDHDNGGNRGAHEGFQNSFGGMGGMGGMGGAFFGGVGGDPFMNDPFFARHHQQHRGFMDPFDLFRSVFGDDFNDGGGHTAGGAGFNNGFGHHGGAHGQGDPFGGVMGRHMDMMNSMMNMHSSFGHNGIGSGGGNGGGFSSYSSSSSSTFGGGNNGGVRESVSTSTRIINGKRQTITERTIVKPDGTVERTTETTGDDDFPASLGYGAAGNQGFSGSNDGRYLQDSSDQQQQQQGGHHRFFGRGR